MIMNLKQFSLIALLVLTSKVVAQPKQNELPIKSIELIHCTHTDYGFTDNPVIVLDLQKRYLDIALDAIIETADSSESKRFYWTAESLDVVYLWWQEATEERRDLLIKAIKSGQLDVNAIPFNMLSFANSRQWNVFQNWVPVDLFKKFHPTIGMMDDVNGFPRSAALGLLDKGINRIWMGINEDLGGAPFKQPSAFWWKMPDGRKLLVWNSQAYWMGYNLFSEKGWRFEQREANNTQFRTPRTGDMLASDEKSVREAHRICVEKLQKMVNEGYSYDFIAISITNQWRCDNDGPFPAITEFVKKWNQLGLQPAIHFTTASKALDVIEKKIGAKIQTYEGEWPDWWSFGIASVPRELSAARMANNYIEAALSPVWGDPDNKLRSRVSEMDKQLCHFWEHTFAANESSENPYSLFNQGNLAEKSISAYRPYENALWLLAQRTRNRLTNEPEGLYVVNTSETPYTGWINLDAVAFRGEKYKSLINTETQMKSPLIFENRTAKFWVENFEGNKINRFTLSMDSVANIVSYAFPDIKTDINGWPVSAQWKGMDKPLFTEGIGNFLSLQSTVGRDIIDKVWFETDNEKRRQKVKECTIETWAVAGEKTSVKETPYSVVYEQKISHPRLNKAVRKIEIWKNEPRAQFSIKFDRLTSSNPEIFYVTFPFPKTDAYPVISNGGTEFLPYKDQLPTTCTDFFTIDGWVHYPSSSGSWIWSNRDAVLVSFGSQQFAVKSIKPADDMNKILAMVYSNMWSVNYLDNCPGEMEFQFDLVWKNKISDPKFVPKIVQTYYLPPVIMINPKTREDKFTFKRMNEIK
jgi:hypothetical protein